VDAELDWREWTDQHDNKREAVTFKARQVLFEGTRPNQDAAADPPGGAAEPLASPAASHADAVPATAAAVDGAVVTADDLPF
jgi:single-stranded DNA-binding protein